MLFTNQPNIKEINCSHLVVLLRNLLISYHVPHGMKVHFFNGYTFLSGWDWVFLAAESLWEGTMGCMDQGRLKETQGLNSSAWNAHLYIYGLTVSPGLPHHGLVFGILVSECLHADPLSGLKRFALCTFSSLLFRWSFFHCFSCDCSLLFGRILINWSVCQEEYEKI